MVHHAEQPGVDLVPLGQRFIQIHAAHYGAQVRGGQRHDRVLQARNFVGRLRCVQHLKEHNCIHADHRVIGGDYFLTRNIQHLLHHVDLVPHAVDEGYDQVQTGIGGEGEFAQPFDRINKALTHHAHAQQDEDDQDKDDQSEQNFHTQ